MKRITQLTNYQKEENEKLIEDIEQGTHETLLELKKKYYLLWITGNDQKDDKNKDEIVKIFADIQTNL